MSNLKLRFLASKPTTNPEAPPVERTLTSKFSAETLNVKTSRLGSISHHRWFPSNSPPTSPTARAGAKPYYQASSSESCINISTPTMVTRGDSLERERAVDTLTDEPEARVKVVGTVDEAFVFAKHQESDSGHSRKCSEATVGNIKLPSPAVWRGRISRSFSSPSGNRMSLRPSRPSPPAPHGVSPVPSNTFSKLDLPYEVLEEFNPFLALSPPIPEFLAVSPPSPPPANATPFSFPVATPDFTPSSAPTTPSVSTFHAHLIRPPTTRAATGALDAALVSLNVGGRTFITSAQTLVRGGRGGKIGEFVEAALNSVRSQAEAKHEGSPDSADSQSLYPSSELVVDDRESYVSTHHFDVSPYTSPFSFSQYDDLNEDLVAALSLDGDSTLVLPSAPSSPCDPFNRKMFLQLPPRPTLSTPKSPPFATTPDVDSPLDQLSFFPSPPSTLHQSTRDSYTSVNSDEDRDLHPYFSVLKSQPYTFVSHNCSRDSLGFPVDAGAFTTEEDQSRSTLLGVPRGEVRRWVKGPREMRKPAPRYDSECGSRPPSLSMSLSSDEGFASQRLYSEPKELEEREEEDEGPMEIFIDRHGDSFVAVLHFLTDGVLPPHLSLPSSSTNSSTPSGIDSTLLSLFALHPPSVITLLASLRHLTAEATWLGLDDLVKACEEQMGRAVEVVAWLEEKARKEKVEDEKRRAADLRFMREKAGWI